MACRFTYDVAGTLFHGVAGSVQWEENNNLTETPGKILVMDDDDNIRTITCILLEKMGYNPMATPDGETAVEEYRRAFLVGNPYDAVIMDITVPDGMGATEAIKKMKAIDPGVCAIVTSGLVSEMNYDDLYGQGFSGVLKKPYRSANLREVIDSVLEPNK